MARTQVNSSVRGERVLKDLGVLAAFERGDTRVLAGPIYDVRKEPGVELRLLFERGEDRTVSIGYARNDGGDWETVELEPYTMRSLGYYERRLKRLGQFVRHQPLVALVD